MIKAVVFAVVLNTYVRSSDLNETEAIKTLNEEKNLRVVGDFISIVPKNTTTEQNEKEFDAFDDYLSRHLIRLKAPFVRNKYFNFELKNLVPSDPTEGRKKKLMGLRDALVPLLLAIKYKATLLTMLTIFVSILALKGFYSGIMGLFLSKLVALKVFLQSQDKSDDEDKEENHDQGDGNYGDEEEHGEKEEPIVIYLNSDKHNRKFSRRRLEPYLVRRYYDPKNWNPWGRQQVFEKIKWGSGNWREEPSWY